MKITIEPVNPAFKELAIKYISEIEEYSYDIVGYEGFMDSKMILECPGEDDPYKAIPPIQKALHRPPLGNSMFCRVVPYGAIQWPPF